MLQITAYTTVLAFWKRQSMENRKLAKISTIYTIFPAGVSDYEKFINRSDPAIEAAILQKRFANHSTDHLFTILYFALIAVNCYLFTVMEW